MLQIFFYFNSEILQDMLILFLFTILVLILVDIYLSLIIKHLKKIKTLIEIGKKVWIAKLTWTTSQNLKSIVDKQKSEDKSDKNEKENWLIK